MATAAVDFGTLSPSAFQQAILSLTRRLPEGYLPKRLAFLLRRIGLASIDRPVDTEVYGVKMRLDPRDNLSEKRLLFMPQWYEVVERSTLLARMHPRFSFVDIGANAGVYSMFVAHHGGPQARIVAVEPDPEMYRRLQFNLQANAFGQVLTVRAAIGDQPGTVTLYLDPRNRGRNSLRFEAGAHDHEPGRAAAGATRDAAGTAHSRGHGIATSVSCLTLLQLLDQTGIQAADALKVDVEGVELQVLGPFLAAAPTERYPRLVILENRRDEPLSPAAQCLLAHGYSVIERSRMNVLLEYGSGDRSPRHP